MATSKLRNLASAPGLRNSWFIYNRKRITKGLIDEGYKHDRFFTFAGGKIILVTHPDLARDVLKRRDDFTKISNEGGSNLDPLYGGYGNLVGTDGKEWLKQRRFFNPAFTTKNLTALIPHFARESDILLNQWEKQADSNAIIDVKQAMSFFALDVLGSAIMGKPFGAQTGQFGEMYNTYSNIMAAMMDPITMLFPWIGKLPLPRNRKLKESCQTMRNFFEDILNKKKDERQKMKLQGTTPEKQDILDMLLGDIGSDCGMEEGYILSNLFIFFVAGHDTTATSLSWIIKLLSMNPDVQNKAREEAQRILGTQKIPSAEQLEDIPYISAVISESLRLNPPVYSILTRNASQDTHLDGYAIPKGTQISIHTQAVNRHAKYWENPHQFDPERFLQKKRPLSKYYIPFSAGPRSCIGDRFSLMEQKTFLLKLLLSMEILPVTKEKMTDGEYPIANASTSIMFKVPAEVSIRLKKI